MRGHIALSGCVRDRKRVDRGCDRREASLLHAEAHTDDRPHADRVPHAWCPVTDAEVRDAFGPEEHACSIACLRELAPGGVLRYMTKDPCDMVACMAIAVHPSASKFHGAGAGVITLAVTGERDAIMLRERKQKFAGIGFRLVIR